MQHGNYGRDPLYLPVLPKPAPSELEQLYHPDDLIEDVIFPINTHQTPGLHPSVERNVYASFLNVHRSVTLGRRGRTPLNLPMVTLLHTSSLSVGNGFHVSEILDYFTLPSLRSFHSPFVSIRNFENLATRSLCKLETTLASQKKLSIVLLCRVLQSLRELGIRAGGMTNRLLEVLRYSEVNLNNNI
jgi:hypothetical protein